MKIELLDHGFVRLVSYTQPVPIDSEQPDGQHISIVPPKWSGDLEIVRNARVSHDADWRTFSHEHELTCLSLLPAKSDGTLRPCNCVPRVRSDERLIHYLWKNRHTSPFECLSFTFEVAAPIFVLRQWHRHRTWAYNEVSARYTELPDTTYTPRPGHIGMQSLSDRQARVLSPFQSSSADFHDPTAHLFDEQDRQRRMVEGFSTEAAHAHERYRARLGENVPREIARINLPLSTYSRMFATVSLLNLFRFLTLRDDDHAQYEIRVYAAALKELVRPICPIAVAAFDRYKFVMVDQTQDIK